MFVVERERGDEFVKEEERRKLEVNEKKNRGKRGEIREIKRKEKIKEIIGNLGKINEIILFIRINDFKTKIIMNIY